MNILISVCLALSIHFVPIAVKFARDPLFNLPLIAFATLTALTLLQSGILLLPGKKGRALALLILFPLALTTFLNIVSLVIFTSPVSLSALFAIMQSNPEEALEFAAAYAKQGAMALVVGLLALGFGIRLYLSQPIVRNWNIPGLLLALALLASLPLLSKAVREPHLAAWDLHEVMYSDRLATSLIRYRSQMAAWEQERRRWQSRGDVVRELKLEVVDPNKLAPLVIIIIGESTTRHNMEIYGYHRPTTPKLSKMKDELLVFDDVITPVAHTIPAVMGALCSEQVRAGNINCTKATLIDIARGAGYKVSWISNQTSVGFDDSVLVHLSQTADHSEFVNRDASSAGEADRNSSLDEKVFAPLDRILQTADAPGAMNMVFIHLMGAHFTYEKRFPAATRLFSKQPSQHLDPIVTDANAKALINSYDNAIAYQDDLLSRIFARVKQAPGDALAIYFSDHGEEVYESQNFHGHNDANLTPAMSEVPLIAIASDRYKSHHKEAYEALKLYQSRPFTTSRLTPSIADLLGLRYRGLQVERSLFSEHFEAEARTTAKGLYSSPRESSLGQQ